MRNRFGQWFLEKARDDERMILLSGDIGFGIFDELINERPEQFLNCGIAEQNMIGVAAGLAQQGYRPFVYTIIPFLLFRPYEFIRNLIGHQNLPVTLVGVGGGFSYDNLGYTHYAKEDLIVASTLPNFDVYSPYDRQSAEQCFEMSLSSTSPNYIRLMKGGEPDLQSLENGEGFSILADNGDDFTIVTHGSVAIEGVDATNKLAAKGLRGKVIAVYDSRTTALKSEWFENKPVLLLEEQIAPGWVSRVIQNYSFNYDTCFITRDLDNPLMTRGQLLEYHGLNSEAIQKKMQSFFS